MLKRLDNFFNGVFSMQVSHIEYIVPLVGMLTELIDMMRDVDWLPENGGYSALYEELFSLHTRNEIQAWFVERVIEPVLSLTKQPFDAHYHQIAMEIEQVIEERFNSNLTLDICAELLHYHPSYLRRVFSEVMGENFGEHLNRRRMEAARKWLIDTDMKIQEIAEQLGYSNSQNFIRCFKAEMGITPGKYRELHRNDKEK